jgi:hypothetical protein
MRPTDPTTTAAGLPDGDCYSIVEFCNRHRITRQFYHRLRNRGLGPREMRLGRRVLITKEAAAAWRAAREAA